MESNQQFKVAQDLTPMNEDMKHNEPERIYSPGDTSPNDELMETPEPKSIILNYLPDGMEISDDTVPRERLDISQSIKRVRFDSDAKASPLVAEDRLPAITHEKIIVGKEDTELIVLGNTDLNESLNLGSEDFLGRNMPDDTNPKDKLMETLEPKSNVPNYLLDGMETSDNTVPRERLDISLSIARVRIDSDAKAEPLVEGERLPAITHETIVVGKEDTGLIVQGGASTPREVVSQSNLHGSEDSTKERIIVSIRQPERPFRDEKKRRREQRKKVADLNFKCAYEEHTVTDRDQVTFVTKTLTRSIENFKVTTGTTTVDTGGEKKTDHLEKQTNVPDVIKFETQWNLHWAPETNQHLCKNMLWPNDFFPGETLAEEN